MDIYRSAAAAFLAAATIGGAYAQGIERKGEAYAPPDLPISRPAPAVGGGLPLGRPSAAPAKPFGVVESGKAPARRAPVALGGTDVSLREALRGVTPAGYAVRPTSCVPTQAPVSYRAGGDWITTLDEIVAGLALRATVDHDLGEVLIDRPPQVSPDTPRTWAVLKSDTTLRRSLERWMAPTCVQLEWDVTFPLDVSADRLFQGATLWEALKQLAEDLQGSETPILITRYSNAVRVTSGDAR